MGPSLDHKNREREELWAKMNEFEENGGQIYYAQIGECKEKPASEFKAKVYENSNF